MKRFSLKVSQKMHASIKELSSQQAFIDQALEVFSSGQLLASPELGDAKLEAQLSFKLEFEQIENLMAKGEISTSRQMLKFLRRLLHSYLKSQKPLHFLNGLDNDLSEVLKKRIRDEWTHDSTSIEGNTLSLGETSFILNEGLTVSGKSLREHDEISGHAKAIDFIYDIYDKANFIDEDLFQLHRVMMINPDFDIHNPVGAWKKEDNGAYWGREYMLYPSPNKTPALMAQWLDEFAQIPQELDVEAMIHAYSRLHVFFTCIHPFFDGNGRMARLLANIPVIRAGYPPITIDSTKRFEYLEIMRHYRFENSDSLSLCGDLKIFKDFIYDQWKKTLDIVAEVRVIQEKRHEH